MAVKRPTEQDRAEALRRLLVGLADGADAVDIAASIADLHPKNNTFPGEVFMELSADVLELTTVERTSPLRYENLCSRFLPEVELKGKENRRIQYAILTSASLRGGLEPDLLDEVIWWPDDYWRYALYATVALIRACADRQEVLIVDLVHQLADHEGIQLA